MTFSDDDLRRLKELISNPMKWSHLNCSCLELKALLARLEAAEKALEGFISLERERVNYDQVVTWLKAWRKSKGE